MANKDEEIRLLRQRWKALENERSSWMMHWQEISDYLLPRNGRFFVQDRNRGERRHNMIYDSTGSRALGTLAAGLMSGLTSPARPWFRLATPDASLMEYQPVKVWLAQVTRIMLAIFHNSNTYRALHSSYEELGAFGTASGIIQPDYRNVIHIFPHTIGEYAIATDWQGNVCTLYRRFEKQVADIVKEFGLENCSKTLQGLYKDGKLDEWVTLMHAIEPRADRDPGKRDARNMAFKSVYFEDGSDDGRFLRESGYRRYPGMGPRWAVSGGDIYGNSPGMEALGDIKQLQHQQLRKGQGIDLMTNPPLQVPAGMKGYEVDTLPGGITYYDAATQQGGIKPLHQVGLRLDYLLEDIRDVRERVRACFHADVFAMISSDPTGKRTATEIAALQEEKMVMLGPVLERLQNEMLDPLINATFDRMIEARIVPPPPKELQGKELQVELVSMLAQAQRAIATNSIDRFVINLGMVANMQPAVLDKFNADVWVDRYGDALGIDPELIVGNDQVALVRKQRAEVQAAQLRAQQAQAQSQALANLGKVDTGGRNLASDVINQFSGYSSGGGSE